MAVSCTDTLFRQLKINIFDAEEEPSLPRIDELDLQGVAPSTHKSTIS
jgi:hypothetical protein